MTEPTVLLVRPARVCCTRGGLYNLVHKGEFVGDTLGQPEYRRVMGDLRRQIVDGQLEVGAPIPSTASLKSQYGVSITVVRRAVAELRNEGLLYGQTGKGVFVRAKPEDVEQESLTIDRLAAGLATLQRQVEGMDSPSPHALAEVTREVRDLRAEVDKLRTELIDLFGRLGQPYPRDAATSARPSTGKRPKRANGA